MARRTSSRTPSSASAPRSDRSTRRSQFRRASSARSGRGRSRMHAMTDSKLYLGCDAGVTGAVVALNSEGRYVESLRLDHDDGTVMLGWLEARRERIVIAYLEEAKPYRGNGVIGAFELG